MTKATASAEAGIKPRTVMFLRLRIRLLLCLMALAVLATGCATTAGSVRPMGSAPTRQDLSQYRNLGLRVIQAEDVKAAPQDLSRILARIIEAINSKQPGRFSEINREASEDVGSQVLEVTVQLTRYDKGNAFARFMLAGLGQIHIDGTVRLKDRATDAPLGDYEVNKTFAWGGIYGVSTTIEDVESGFAEAVAIALLGEEGK